MPLSEREQKLLDQLEQQLYADDPAFATNMQKTAKPGLDKKRLVLGSLGALAGLGLVLAGVATQQIWIGVIGFVVMVVGGYLAATPRRKGADLRAVGSDGSLGAARKASAKRAGGRSPFMQRLEQRWEERRRNGQL